MTKQTEAQWLADSIDRFIDDVTCKKAAAELRRLDADKDDWKDASFVFKERAVKAETRIKELEAANAELLEALNWLDKWIGEKPLIECANRVRKAIKKHGSAA